MPVGECSILIPAGITVTLNGSSLLINVRTLTIDGTFTIISNSTDGFTFNFAINVLVRKGGSLQDQTNSHKLYCHADTLFTFLEGASFTGVNTQVFAFTSLPATGSLGANFTFGSTLSGPFTFGVLVDGSIQTFTSVTCIVRQTGSFTANDTWLGGVAPSVDFCSSAGGCQLYVPTGITLSTASLNGVLAIQFTVITVSTGGSFLLGAPGLIGGFRFKFLTVLNCFGKVEDVTGGAGGIFVPVGSNVNFFASATFSSVVATFIRVFNLQTGETIGDGLSLSVSFAGPYFLSVAVSGAVTVSSSSNVPTSLSTLSHSLF